MLANNDLTGAGLAIMACSLISVCALLSFCLFKVLSLPPVEEQSLKAPLDIDTRDRDRD